MSRRGDQPTNPRIFLFEAQGTLARTLSLGHHGSEVSGSAVCMIGGCSITTPATTIMGASVVVTQTYD